jgi:hypothetical protein
MAGRRAKSGAVGERASQAATIGLVQVQKTLNRLPMTRRPLAAGCYQLRVESRSPAAHWLCISFRPPLLFSSSCINKYSSDDQAPIIYSRLTPHCILGLAHYAFPTSFSLCRLLPDLQDNSIYRNNIYVPVLPEKRKDRIVPAPPIELNCLRAVFKTDVPDGIAWRITAIDLQHTCSFYLRIIRFGHQQVYHECTVGQACTSAGGVTPSAGAICFARG